MHAALRTSAVLAACLAGSFLALPLATTSAEAGMRRPDWGLYGVDMTPIGTARQVERLRRMRQQRP